MDKISVIILIYNVDKYLNRCIESVVNQTYRNLEILLVDDGSPDKSLEICQHWVKNDPRIRIIYESNQGRGIARNMGISHATGDFITFVDGDDFITPDYVKHLHQQQVRYHSDIAVMSFLQVDNLVTYYTLLNPVPGDQQFDRSYRPLDWINTSLAWNSTPAVGPCGKLFRRTLFNQVKFSTDSVAEDATTTWKLYFAVVNRVSFKNDTDYVYTINPKSATHAAAIETLNISFRAWTEELAVIAAMKQHSNSLNKHYRQVINQLGTKEQLSSDHPYFYHVNLLKRILTKRHPS